MSLTLKFIKMETFRLFEKWKFECQLSNQKNERLESELLKAQEALKEAEQEFDEDLKTAHEMIAQANVEKGQMIARANEEQQQLMARARGDQEQLITRTNSEREELVARANVEQDRIIARAKAEKEQMEDRIDAQKEQMLSDSKMALEMAATEYAEKNQLKEALRDAQVPACSFMKLAYPCSSLIHAACLSMQLDWQLAHSCSLIGS